MQFIRQQTTTNDYSRLQTFNQRQQTTTVDYKRLINGLVLTGIAILQRKTL